MNYRHAFHAGNFADVVKHAALVWIVEYLKKKPAPFRVIDTHAGTGLYDLDAEAARTGEWQHGIGRLLDPAQDARRPLSASAALALKPYLEIVRGLNGAALDQAGEPVIYPGSPFIARAFLRESDQLIANELHPEDNAKLRALFARDPQVKVMALDGWIAIRSLLPPKERRGLLLIDPPFEQAGEFDRIVQGLEDARQRFASGIVLVWYPIKDVPTVLRYYRDVAALGLARASSFEFHTRALDEAEGLTACGLTVVNAPYGFTAAIGDMLGALSGRLGRGKGSRWIAVHHGTEH